MSIYVGANNAKKEAAQLYLGRDGTKSEVTEVYALKDGTIEQMYASKAKPGQTIFTTSGTFTVPKGVKSVDVFLVGGGGAGGTTFTAYVDGAFDPSTGQTKKDPVHYFGNGGGGGYTKTVKAVSVNSNEDYDIIVGAGATCVSSSLVAQNAGSSSALGYTVNGGECGFHRGTPRGYIGQGLALNEIIFGSGGSGGGQGACLQIGMVDTIYDKYGGNGGSNGSYGMARSDVSSSWNRCENLKGQQSTTRAFGEYPGTLYSGGGGGGKSFYGNSSSGTGGDGGGGTNSQGTDGAGGGGFAGYKGGTGCVIIRWN